MSRRDVAGWLLFGFALLGWGFLLGYGAWDFYHLHSGFFPGLGGALLMKLLAPTALLPALIGALVGKGWSRAANLWLMILIVAVAS